MTPKLELIPCLPTGKATGIGCGPGGCRPVTVWTPTRVKLAQARAEMGDLREAADICMAILGDHRVPTYAETPGGERLRAMRTEKRLTLSVFRTAFGLSPADTSGLEWGRTTLSADDWKKLFQWLERVEPCGACDGLGRARGNFHGRRCEHCQDGAIVKQETP